MKVLVAGASGAIGKQLVPMLVERGYEVAGTTRGDNYALIQKMGATPVKMNGLDANSVAAAVSRTEPEVIIHELTSIGEDVDLRKFEKTFAATNRLRREGTDHLLSAARAVGSTRRFIAQSFAGWPYERTGGWVKTEEDPLDPNPVPKTRLGLDSIKHLEMAVANAGPEIEGLVLRYGGFYGPGTSLRTNPDGAQTAMVRRRKFPIAGTGAGRWSLIHVVDAASATLAAVERGEPGIYNITDDEPAPIAEILPVLAREIGAKPPRHVPLWLGRLLGGAAVPLMMEQSRGASNEKAKRELGWQPYFSSWRQGFRSGMESVPEAALPQRVRL